MCINFILLYISTIYSKFLATAVNSNSLFCCTDECLEILQVEIDYRKIKKQLGNFSNYKCVLFNPVLPLTKYETKKIKWGIISHIESSN